MHNQPNRDRRLSVSIATAESILANVPRGRVAVKIRVE